MIVRSTAHVEVRSQRTTTPHSRIHGRRNSRPDRYVAVQIVPHDAAKLRNLNSQAAKCRGITIRHFGQGYSSRSGLNPRSALGVAIAAAKDFADYHNSQQAIMFGGITPELLFGVIARRRQLRPSTGEANMKIPPGLSGESLLNAVERQVFELENPGFCTDCGAEYDDCEPDTARRKCDECGEKAVFGAEEIMIRLGDVDFHSGSFSFHPSR